MTAQRFIKEIEGYYGEYEREATRKYVLDYISKNYSDRSRDRLFKRLLLDYSGQFKVTPDIAVLEGIKVKLLQEPDYHAPAKGILLPWIPRGGPTDKEREEMWQHAKDVLDELAEKKRMRESARMGRKVL